MVKGKLLIFYVLLLTIVLIISINSVKAQTCSDGTPYGQCSSILPYYCDNGRLVSKCSICGCSDGIYCEVIRGKEKCSLVTGISCKTNSTCPLGYYCPKPTGKKTTSVCTIKKCSDNTYYGSCSSTKPLYCDNGALINKCSSCSCPSGQTCQSDGSCVAVVNQTTTCTDSDGGVNLLTKGTTTGWYRYPLWDADQYVTYTDSCTSSTYAREWMCSYDGSTPEGHTPYVVPGDYVCPGGCSDGTCILLTGTDICGNGICETGEINYAPIDSSLGKYCPTDCSPYVDPNYSPANQTCSDGTLYTSCSSTKPLYCDNGALINKCSSCGCPSEQTCQSDGSCITSTNQTSEFVVEASGTILSFLSILTGRATSLSGTAPLKVQFKGSVTGGDAPFEYYWDFQDGTTSDLQNPQHTYTISKNYNVLFRATDVNGDSSVSYIIVNVNKKPEEVEGNISTFSDGSTKKDITLNPSESQTVHVEVPKKSEVESATINVESNNKKIGIDIGNDGSLDVIIPEEKKQVKTPDLSREINDYMKEEKQSAKEEKSEAKSEVKEEKSTEKEENKDDKKNSEITSQIIDESLDVILVPITFYSYSQGTITISNLDIVYKTKTHSSLLDLIKNLFR